MKEFEVIPIPVPCPNCDGKMVGVRYDAPLKVLQERSWQICRDCKFARSAEDFKNTLLTI